MSERVVVRPARVEDLGAVVAMDRAAATAPHWAEAAYAGMLVGAEGRERCLLVAEVDGELRGFGAGSFVRALGVGEVENLVVVEAARRRGVGRAICLELVAWARAAEAGVMELEVRAGNAGARTLYEGLGFVEVGRRKGYYGAGEDAVLMELRWVQ